LCLATTDKSSEFPVENGSTVATENNAVSNSSLNIAILYTRLYTFQIFFFTIRRVYQTTHNKYTARFQIISEFTDRLTVLSSDSECDGLELSHGEGLGRKNLSVEGR